MVENNEKVNVKEKIHITENKKARHEFFIEETYEAGISLIGTEVKSLRAGRANLTDAYAVIKNGEAWLMQAHISPYREGTYNNHEPKRSRKLLLHKFEIRKLHSKVNEKGYTLVPIRMYFFRGKVKVEIAVAKGKKLYDKRDSIAEKDARRQIERGMRHQMR
ncbi:MAG: SsrA-binding protein SmpB [Candidatus Xenobiia bacterium LiM19]